MSTLSREDALKLVAKARSENGGISPEAREKARKDFPEILDALANVRRQLAGSMKLYDFSTAQELLRNLLTVLGLSINSIRKKLASYMNSFKMPKITRTILQRDPPLHSESLQTESSLIRTRTVSMKKMSRLFAKSTHPQRPMRKGILARRELASSQFSKLPARFTFNRDHSPSSLNICAVLETTVLAWSPHWTENLRISHQAYGHG